MRSKRLSERILLVCNSVEYYYSHRKAIADAAIREGFDVHVALPDPLPRPEATRPTFHQIPISRAGRSIKQQIGLWRALRRLYRHLHPHLIHHITIKPVFIGTIAAAVVPSAGVLNGLTGLGYVFIDDRLSIRLARYAIIRTLARRCRSSPRTYFCFQNRADQSLFVNAGVVPQARTSVILGSGVDLEKYAFRSDPAGVPAVVFPGRFLRHKGICEYLDAARLLKEQGVSARFVLAGDVDSNPASLTTREIRSAVDAGLVEWSGWQRDMKDMYDQVNIACLPSYREGLPKALVEAAACGLPIVTSEAPGCSEVVKSGRNGFRVPIGDSTELAAALRTLVDSRETRVRMGLASRELAEKRFGKARIMEETMSLYRTVLSRAVQS